MNPEALERLLIDRELGELSPEASELLAAYLNQNPTEASGQLSVAKTLDLARRALQPAHGEEAPALPPFPHRRAHPTAIGRRRFAAWVRTAALAAGIVLAFFLGMRFSPRPAESPVTGQLALSQARTATGGFWTLSGREKAVSRATRDDQHIEWPAPFTPALKGERS